MVAGADSSLKESTFGLEKFGLKLLKSAAIYGANASGKSKLFDAVELMKELILHSAKESQANEPIPYNPFRLHTDTESAPMEFEIVFVHEKIMYRYGFESTEKEIVGEWLYRKTNVKEIGLFERNYQDISFHKTQFKVKDLVANDRIRPNALMLSVAANWNNSVAIDIFDWLTLINVLDAKDEDRFSGFTVHEVQEGKKLEIIAFLKSGGIDISDIKIQEMVPDEDFPPFIRKLLEKSDFIHTEISFLRKKYGSRGSVQENLFEPMAKEPMVDYGNMHHVATEVFSLAQDESSGTKQLFALAGPILDTLKNGKVLLVDELESKLHPKLTKMIVGLFNSAETNPKGGQLIFNTHNTNLLTFQELRRDQIWITDKDKFGASSLYALSDFKGVRKDENVRKKYFTGAYGGVPAISSSRIEEVLLGNQ